MYDTARRVELVKRQIRKNTRRRQKRGIGRLSAVCMLLFAVLLQTADRVIGQGQTDAGGGVLVAVVSFAAAVVITALCFRLRIMENQKKDGTGKPARHEQEEKSQ